MSAHIRHFKIGSALLLLLFSFPAIAWEPAGGGEGMTTYTYTAPTGSSTSTSTSTSSSGGQQVSPTNNIDACVVAAQVAALAEGEAIPPPIPEWQITTRVVTCLRNTIVNTSQRLLGIISDFMAGIAGVVFALAAVFFGFRMMAKDPSFSRDSIGFLIRIAIIVLLSYNLAGLGRIPFNVVEDAASIVSGGLQPWIRIDIMLGNFLGFGPEIALFQGILGLVGAAMASSTTGAMLFFVGIAVIMMLLSVVLRCVFTYLVALLLIAYLVMISPMVFIPAAFQFGEQRYLKRWLDVLMAAMLQPVLLFGFLWIFLGFLDTTVSTFFDAIGGRDFMVYWRSNMPMFSWSVMSDPAISAKLQGATSFKTSGLPLVQSFMNPAMMKAIETNMLSMATMDFGPDSMQKLHSMIMELVGVGVVLFLIRSMINQIPALAEDIAGAVTGVGFEEIPFVGQLGKAIGKG